jgi:hypothetical protein
MAEADKRGAPRISFPCELECPGAGDHPRLSDLSATGAFIDSLNEAPTGSRLSLKFALPTGTVVTVNAEVVHSMPLFGMGVRFVDLADDQRRAIEQVVAGGR